MNIVVPLDELVRRLSTRQRIDDDAETVRKRLDVYEQETKPLLEYYSSRPTFRVVNVNGAYPPEQVAAEVAATLDSAAAGTRLRPKP